MANSYWADKIAAEEAKTQRLAASAVKQEQKLYRQALKKIDDKVNALYAQIKDGAPVSRSQLWQYKHYVELRNTIYQECKALGLDQISMMDQIIEEVYERTLGIKPNETQGLISLNEEQIAHLKSQAWSGQDFSSRVWTNTNALAARLENDIADLVVLGKNPDEIKKELMNDMNVSYRQADRLVRTEASHSFNQANLERYKNMGAKGVSVLTESDCCEECAELEGKVFRLEDAPILPVHPNCRCSYAPEIEID